MIIYIYNNKTKIKTTCINLFLLNIEDHGQVVQLPILINYKKKKQKNKKTSYFNNLINRLNCRCKVSINKNKLL